MSRASLVSGRIALGMRQWPKTVWAAFAAKTVRYNPTTTTAYVVRLRGGDTSSDLNKQIRTMSETTTPDIDVWNGSNKDLFDSLQHPGYSVASNPSTHVGGWLAHRAIFEETKEEEKKKCWIETEIAPLITRFDYMTMPIGRAPKILVLYGSLRPESFSRKLAYEFARLLDLLGCDVRVYNPRGLPVRDPALEKDIKVQELRALTQWSDGHMWVSVLCYVFVFHAPCEEALSNLFT